MPYNITRDELNHMVKKILGSFTKIKNLEKEKDLNNLLKKKNKGSSTGKKIECSLSFCATVILPRLM